MRDIPFFTTDSGVSALALKEIPYRSEAYIRVLEVQKTGLSDHIAQCASFCRMAGAEKIYATGHPDLDRWPLYTAVAEMRGSAWVDKEKLACVFPVTEATVTQWRGYYNRKMSGVDNAATLESRDEKRILDSGGAYYIHENGTLLGIGWLEDCKLLAIAAEPGQGQRVLHSLMSLVEGASMTLEVASTNSRAIRLYEKLGFLKVSEISRWYKIR